MIDRRRDGRTDGRWHIARYSIYDILWVTAHAPSGAVLHSSRKPGVRCPCSDLMDMLRCLINCCIIIIITIKLSFSLQFHRFVNPLENSAVPEGPSEVTFLQSADSSNAFAFIPVTQFVLKLVAVCIRIYILTHYISINQSINQSSEICIAPHTSSGRRRLTITTIKC